MRASATLGWVLALTLAGCGKEGPPRPPEPRGPLAPQAVAVRQLGEQIQVRFRTGGARGDRRGQQIVRAELVRVDYAPGVEPPNEPSAFRRRGTLVATIEGDPLDESALLSVVDGSWTALPDGGMGRTLRYGVRLRDARGRASPLVVTRDLVPARPGSPPLDLAGEATADGVRLRWRTAEGSPASFNVYRSVAGEPPPVEPLNRQPIDVAEYLDGTVSVGTVYRYEVRIALRPGSPRQESLPGRPFELRAEDRFPPAPPQGLVAVQEGPAVRLFWNPNGERDLAGYRIYRADADRRTWERVGPDPVPENRFLDRDIGGRTVLVYRITAVDRADPPNESRPSAPAAVDLARSGFEEPAGEEPR